MSLLHDEMRSAYRAQRGVSQGAGITLVSRSCGFSAFFESATRCSQLLGNRQLENRGTDAEKLLVFTIPTEDLHRSITKLSEMFSVALVDLATDENGSRFVLIWKIPARAESINTEGLLDTRAYELNSDGSVTFEVGPLIQNDPNQSVFNLDEY